MTDEARKRRALFRRFASMAAIVPEHPDYEKALQQIKSLEKNPEFKLASKKQAQRASYLTAAFQINGPSLYADVYLRNFLLEFNNRIFKGRGNEQPTSFNILGAFVTPDERAFALKLLGEKFFQFNLLDYLDYITSGTSETRFDPDDFDELVIYELNTAGSFAEVTLLGFSDLVFCGAAIVREGNELSVMGVFGNATSHFMEMEQVNPETISPAKREFIGDGPWDLRAEKFFASEKFYPLIALTRFDGTTQRIQAQYVMHESKDTFRVTTDDPAVIFDLMQEHGEVRARSTFRHSVEELAKYRHVFDLLYNMVHFPRFYQAREDDFYVERHPTGFKLRSQTTHLRKVKTTLESEYCPNYRDILTLAQSGNVPEASELDQAHFRFESSGFWRTLPLDKTGTDKHGNPVHGKTWVQQQLSWREIEAESSVSRTAVKQVDRADDIGFIYVMRSPAHERNIYKIGFTKRDPEDRASDLSGTSGQPDALVVLISWKVMEPRRVEQEIHKALSKERINTRREFFKAKFEKLRETIESIISSMHARAQEMTSNS
jgi:hypothetical protein